ncbi:HNH endonuclease signature motif containing protein [Aeromicrobium terrae]|uniref:HNH endonuclease n=1 Tax=Aeromicrobium terrae TaxID=2498846 RepID=A0A5C8NFI7_9ACTN|nr:HNH endonuclease signature motif containing protein [Aeromicrobium terrae]TXL57575.1 HNH endonuclease [Aeromicrobium terrae]
MFEDVPAGQVLDAVACHAFSDPLERAGQRLDGIRALDRLIRAAQAAQAELIVDFYEDPQALHMSGGSDMTTATIAEISLARNISPGAAGNQFGFALGLSRLPSVHAALRDGVISEPTAKAVVNETVALDGDALVLFDGEITDRLTGLTPGRARLLARRLVIAIDAEAARRREERNRADQRVSLMPELDGVAVLQVRGPAEQLVAAHKTLESWALGLRSTGDERPVGTIMVQTLVERLTGRTHVDDLDVEIGVVVGAETLVGADHQPAEIDGYGPISPDLADTIISRAHRAFYRRLITDPLDHTLVGRDPRRRRFDGPLAGYLKARDRRCRQPGCDCRIRDLDHIRDHQHGGPTAPDNGQGLCRRSHTFKHLPGWNVTRAKNGDLRWRTAAGRTYTSTTPPYLVRSRT